MSANLGRIGLELENRLQTALSPSELAVIDQSADHAGHSGARPEGETHFLVDITSSAFAGQSRLACQRLVYDAVGDLMNNPVHALAIKTRVSAG